MIPNILPKSLVDNPRLDRWLTFRPDGTVGVRVGKVELGQGIITALAQIAAEELDLPPDRLDMLAGDTDVAPDEGMTTSSQSIETGGASLRLVCAEVRALFVAAAAAQLGCPADTLTVADGAIQRDGAPTGLDYAGLAARVPLARDATGGAPSKRPAEHRIVGRSLPRLDLPAKVAGGGFIHDIVLPGIRHARVLRQPRPDAHFAGLDEARLRHAARGEITLLHDGDFVAVVADIETVARRAADAAETLVTWEGAASVDPAQGEAAWLMTAPADHRELGLPRPAGLAGDRHVATYSRPYLSHASLGPSCALAQFEDGRLEVWTNTQGVYPLRAAIAGVLGLDPAAVHLRHAHGAGCYGHNGADDAAMDAALIATRLPGRPVRVLWSRADEFRFDPAGTAMVVRLDAVLDAAGRPADLTTEIWSGVHVGRAGARLLAARALPGAKTPPPLTEASEPRPGTGTRNAVPYYAIPSHRIRHHLVTETPVRTSALRGLGALPNVFALECFIDELAERAGADPVAYRLALLADPRARRVVETAATMAGWPVHRAGGGDGRGLGIGFARYKNASAYAAVVIEVEVAEEVRLRRAWCAADAGLVINPDGLINQLEGGIIQAASWTLKEQITLDVVGIATRTWADYPILRFSETPDIETVLLGAAADPPLGVGECTMGPTAAAIGNAVAQALGIRLRDLPLTRERIIAALG